VLPAADATSVDGQRLFQRRRYEPGSRGPGVVCWGCDPGEYFEPPTPRAWIVRRSVRGGGLEKEEA
jgi:hypothetical protein